MTSLDDLLADHPLPDAEGDKHGRGTVLVVGGGEACPGGAVLAGTAALRAGAGRVQLAVHPSVAVAVGVAFPEAFVVPWPPAPDVVAGVDAVVIGPGLGDEAVELARAVAASVDRDTPLLLDAGSLPAAWELASSHTLLLAPNHDEAAELLDADTDDDVEELAIALAARTGHTVAVRGVETTVADPDGRCWRSAAGHDGLGTAGSGDVLAGIVGGLLARGAAPLAALGWAVTVHARAGSLAGAEVAPVGYLAREVLERVSRSLPG